MKKIAIGAWAFGQYPAELFRNINALGFDGVGIGSSKPLGIHPDEYDTDEKRKELKRLLAENQLEIPEYGIDMYGAHALLDSDRWIEWVEFNLDFADRLDVTRTVRVDTGVPPRIPDGMTYAGIKDFYKTAFRRFAKRAAGHGIDLVWEFEPGFILNEPANVVEVVRDVGEPNFKVEFDTCHANNCALGIGHIEEGMKLLGGIEEFAQMCRDMVGMVHIIDTDGTLVRLGLEIMGDNGEKVELITSKHSQMGEGYLNFDKIIPAILDKANYKGDWWVLDLEVTPFEDVKKNLDAMKRLNEKYCK